MAGMATGLLIANAISHLSMSGRNKTPRERRQSTYFQPFRAWRTGIRSAATDCPWADPPAKGIRFGSSIGGDAMGQS